MRRRTFLWGASTGAFAFGSFPKAVNATSSLVPYGNYQAAYSFITMSRHTDSQNIIILQGAGSLKGDSIEGAGTFTFFDPTGMLPYPIYNFGSWTSAELVKFETASRAEFGSKIAANLEMKVKLLKAYSQPCSALLRIKFSGFEELTSDNESDGVTLIEDNGATFRPMSGVGGTLLTLNK